MAPLGLLRFVFAITFLKNNAQSQGPPELIILMTELHSASTRGVIYKLTAHHMNFTLLPVTNIITPAAIDYDIVNKHVYWTDITTEQVRRADLQGNNDVVVASLNNISYPEGLAVDGAAGKIFYTDRGNKVIVRIDMDGFSKRTIVRTGLDRPMGITVDKTNKKLYWVEHRKNQIMSSDYHGNSSRSVTTDAFRATGIAINEKAGRLYWCQYNGKINSIRTDGTGKSNLLTNSIFLVRRYTDIALFNGFLYSTEKTRREITIIPENGGVQMYMRSKAFENIHGIHVFSPNSVETGCPEGKYGVGCTAVCGRCAINHPCEKTVGVCLGGCEPGYQIGMCIDVCTAGTYGKNCSSSCGQCRQGSTCHHVTGQCPRGCQSGWKGAKCEDKAQKCLSGKYGPGCLRDCGYCAGGDTCHSEDGQCPFGCALGWTGMTCQRKIITGKSGASTIRNGLIGALGMAVVSMVFRCRADMP